MVWDGYATATYAESEGVGVPPQFLHEPYLQEGEQLGLGCVRWRVHLDTLLGEERRGEEKSGLQEELL